MDLPVGPKIRPLSNAGVWARVCAAAPSRALTQDGMHAIPEGAIDDGLMLAGIGDALVHCLAEVDAVVQNL